MNRWKRGGGGKTRSVKLRTKRDRSKGIRSKKTKDPSSDASADRPSGRTNLISQKKNPKSADSAQEPRQKPDLSTAEEKGLVTSLCGHFDIQKRQCGPRKEKGKDLTS